jgi:hypothetical protein
MLTFWRFGPEWPWWKIRVVDCCRDESSRRGQDGHDGEMSMFEACTGPFHCLLLVNALSWCCDPLKNFWSSHFIKFRADMCTFAFFVLAPKWRHFLSCDGMFVGFWLLVWHAMLILMHLLLVSTLCMLEWAPKAQNYVFQRCHHTRCNVLFSCRGGFVSCPRWSTSIFVQCLIDFWMVLFILLMPSMILEIQRNPQQDAMMRLCVAGSSACVSWCVARKWCISFVHAPQHCLTAVILEATVRMRRSSPWMCDMKTGLVLAPRSTLLLLVALSCATFIHIQGTISTLLDCAQSSGTDGFKIQSVWKLIHKKKLATQAQGYKQMHFSCHFLICRNSKANKKQAVQFDSLYEFLGNDRCS